jgi:hypothetical protein
MKSLVGKISGIMILLVIIIASILILKQAGIVKAQTEDQNETTSVIANESIENVTIENQSASNIFNVIMIDYFKILENIESTSKTTENVTQNIANVSILNQTTISANAVPNPVYLNQNTTLSCDYRNASDDNSITQANVTFNINGINYTALWNGEQWIYTFNSTGTGNKTVYCFAESPNFESNSTSLVLTTGIEEFNIKFLPDTPSNGSTINTNWTFIAVRLSKNGSAILEWNGVNESMLGFDNNFYLNKTDLKDGLYNYRVFARDIFDNWVVTESMLVYIKTEKIQGISNYTFSKYTPFTETHCLNGKCWVAIYGGIRFVEEDGEWKKIEDAKSLKGKGFQVVYLENDGEHNIEVEDFNYTTIKFKALIKSNKSVNKKIPFKLDNIIKKDIRLKDASEKSDVVFELDNVFAHNYTFGEGSTTIKLQYPDNETLDDTHVGKAYPTQNYGSNQSLRVYQLSYSPERIYIKFNISSVPANQVIENAQLALFLDSYSVPGPSVSAYNVYNQTWTEETITWDDQPCNVTFDSTKCNSTAESAVTISDLEWINWTVTNAVLNSYSQGNKNVSIMLKTPEDSSTSKAASAFSKEYTTASFRPYLNITYSPDTTAPTYSKNTTNTTVEGKPCNFSLEWADNIFLNPFGQYIFSTNNTFNENNPWTGSCSCIKHCTSYPGCNGYCTATTCSSRNNSQSSSTCSCDQSGDCSMGPVVCSSSPLTCTPTGNCSYTCDSGYYNCDGNNTNGCEATTPCWTNYTAVNFTTTPQNATYVKTLPSIFTTIAWCFYATDNAGNWNGTNCQSGNQFLLTTTDDIETPPTIGTVNIQPTSGSYTASSFIVNASVSDNFALNTSSCAVCNSTSSPCNSWSSGTYSGSSTSGYCYKSCSGYSDGQVIYANVTINDTVNNIGTGTQVSRTIDATNPTSSIPVPDSGSWQNQSFNANLTYTDSGSGLQTCQYKVNTSSGTRVDWTSAGSCSGSSWSTNKSITVGTSSNCNVQGANACTVQVRANDSVNNAGSETSKSFSIDWTAPSWSLNSTNTSRAGTPVLFSLNWSDNINLSSYRFYLDNCTGNFVNIQNVTLTGQANWSNVTVTVNDTLFCRIRWYISANDTANLWNTSNNFSFYTVPTFCDKDIPGLPYTITESNKYYCLINNTSTSGNGITFASGVQNSTLDGLGFYINGTGTSTGINITGSNTINNTIKNISVTHFNYGIYISLSSNNSLSNSTVRSNAIGIYLNSTSNNNFTGGSIDSSTDYDYYLSNAGTTNYFISTNFTTRKVRLADTTSWFNYNNRTSDTTTVMINVPSPVNITRKITSWNITYVEPTYRYDIMFNDSATQSLTSQYNVTGLLTNRMYLVSSNGILVYKLNTTEKGEINFTIDLSTTDTNIYVKYPHPPFWYNISSWSPANYSTTPSQFNVTWIENVAGINQTFIDIWNDSYVLVNNSSMSNAYYGGGIYNFSIVLPAGTWYWRFYANDIDQPYPDWNSTDTYNLTIYKENSPPQIQRVLLKTENLGGNEVYTLIANYSGCSDCQNYTTDDIHDWYFDDWGQQISFDNNSLVLNLTNDISFPFSKNLTLNDTLNNKTTYNITLNLQKPWYYQNETGINNRTYQLIARNATWQNNAPSPINISWNFSSSPGAVNNVTAQSGEFNLSAGSSQNQKTVWYGDWIVETNESWRQDPTNITTANGTAYVTHDIWLNNSWNFTITNLNIEEYLTNRSDVASWNCTKLTNINVPNSTNTTFNQSINCTANNIILGYQTLWAQNTSIQSNTSIQYINTTVNVSSNDTISYNNVSYSHPNSCPNGFTCSGFSTTMNYTVPVTTGNKTYYSGYGNVIIATNNTWAQDSSRTSTETIQYINYTVNLSRNDTPTVTIILNDSNNGNVGDSYTDSISPNSNYGTDTWLHAGAYDTYRAYNLWILSVIPSGSTITNANLSLYGAGPGPSTVITAYNTTNGWNESVQPNITWDNQPALGTAQDVKTISSSYGYVYFNVTNAAISQFSQSNKNLSIALANSSEPTTFNMYSKEYSTVNQRPQLIITYIPPISINFTNIYYPNASNCPNNFSSLGSSVPNYYTVNINGNLTIYNCSGNVITIGSTTWAQNTSNSSQTINSQHINESIKILRNDTGYLSNYIVFNSLSYTPSGYSVCTAGFTCYPVNPESVTSWYIPSNGNITLFWAYGDGIINEPGAGGWQQNLTFQSSVTNVSLRQSLYLENWKLFDLNNLNYDSSAWSCGQTCTNNCPNGFTCSDMSGTISLSQSSGQTIWARAYGNVINESQTNWSQNTTATSNFTVQYLNSTVNLTRTDGSNLTFVNISYPSVMQCPTYYTGNVPINYTVNTSVNMSYLSCSGDSITENWLNWQQDWTRISVANGTAFITRNITIQNNASNQYLNFTNLQTNWRNQNRTYPFSWNCNGADIFNINYNSWNNTTMIMNCSASNIIQPINTSDWVQDNSSATIAGGNAYVKGKSYFNNTDNVSYINVVANSSSYYNKTLNRSISWNCSWNSSYTQSDMSFSAYSVSQTSDYSVLCNQNNTITKIDQSWSSDNSTEQNVTNQWIIKKINGTNTDNVNYINVNYTISEFPNCKNNYTCNVTSENISVNAGQPWERWIGASNSSAIINTVRINRYVAPDYYQNISINDTGDIIFYNLTGWSVNFNDTNITAGTEYIKYWNGTQFVEITPTSNDTNCNTSSPVYTSNSTSNGTFYVCKKDLDSNGKIDYFKFKIPKTSNTTVQIIQIGGLDLIYPTFNNNGTNTTIPNYGKAVLIYANWSDDVALSQAWLWTNETGGTGRNYTDGTYNSTFLFSSNSQWSNFTWQNTSILPGSLISWKVYANDSSRLQNVTEGSFRVWGWANVTEINIKNLYDTNKLNRSINVIACRVQDANFSYNLTNYPVNFYKNDTLQTTNLTNSTGYAVWNYNSTPDLGGYILKCNISDNETLFYNKSVNQINSTVYVWRKLYLDLTTNPTTIYRIASYQPDKSIIQAYFYDDNSTILTSKQVCFYRYYPGQNLDQLSCPNTNSSGYAIYNYNATLLNDNFGGWPPQNYSFYVNHSILDYSYSVDNTTNLLIKGKLYPNITSPLNNVNYYKNQIVSLNSETKDEYNNIVTLNSTNWTLIETSELLNQSENGQWNISINHGLGNFTINYSVSKDWFETNWTSKNVSLFGQSAVNETGSNLVYRGLTSNYTGTVYDYQNNTGISNYVCLWWLNSINEQNLSTNSTGHCVFSWNSNCSNSAGRYYVNVSIGNNTSIFYDVSAYNVSYVLVNLTGNLSTRIDYPSTNSIWHRGENISVNSTVTDDCNNNFNDSNVTANWYLNSLSASGINSTISIPINHDRGQKTLITNVTANYYVLGTNTSSIYIYGWANITNITPLPETVPKGTIVTVVCHVKDANTTENLTNYPVNFYKNDSLNGTYLTNSSGYAIWNWSTINDDAGANYIIKCNITNNESLLYNKTYPYEQNTTVGLSSGVNIDILTRSQNTIDRNDTCSGCYQLSIYESLINVHVKEAAIGDSNNSNVKFYNSTTEIGNCTTDASGYCNVTFNPPDNTIPQNYTIYINATKQGYSDSPTNQTWIIVKGSITSSGVSIIYPPASPKMKNYRGNWSWFNSSITDENNQILTDTTVYWRNFTTPSSQLIAGPGNGTENGTIPINHPLGNSILIYEHINKTYYDNPPTSPSREIMIWGWSNVSLLTPSSTNINRGSNVDILCRVTDANTSESLSNYQISFWNDSTSIYNFNSNSTGYVNYTWNTSFVLVGSHKLNCTVPQNSTKFYDGAFNISSVNITLIGNLTASLVSVSQDTIYRNDTWAQQNSQNYLSRISVNITNEYSNPVANANVSFYQNESFLGYCSSLTDSTGNCTYVYNPSENLTPTAYSIKFNASAQNYYNSNTVETFINVKGKLISIIIYNPSKMYKNETYWFNSTTNDENGYQVTPVTGAWRLGGTLINTSENSTWNVTFGTGNYQITYNTNKEPYYDATDQTSQNSNNTQIWTKANITLYLPSDAIYNRSSSITYYANVTDIYNNSKVSGYDCSWWLDGLNINSSLTNSQGTCNWTWSTGCSNVTRDYAGLHTINSTISSNSAMFYDTNVSNSNTTTTLQGNLSILINSPTNNYVLHKTDSIWLNSTVNSECPSETISTPTVNWTLNNSQNINIGVNVLWTIPTNQTPNSYFINSTVNKTYYYSTYNTTNIQIWGWTNVSWIYPLTGNYSYSDNLNLTCRVTDANNSTSISNYNVSFWKNESFINSSLTSSGNATHLWNTTPEQLGLFMWKCNITNNSTLYYNASIAESSANLTLVDGTPPTITNLSILPNSSFETNYNYTNMSVDVTDNFAVHIVWVQITLPNTTKVNITMNNISTNNYRANYTPVLDGLYNVTIYANDTTNNIANTSSNFTAVGIVTGIVLKSPTGIIYASDITRSNNYTFVLNVTLNNTGLGTMRFVNISLILPTSSSGFYANNTSTSESCPNLTIGQNCTKVFTFNITTYADEGTTQTITLNSSWQNPDYSISSTSNTTSVSVVRYTVLFINETQIIDNASHNTTKTVGNFTIYPWGNTILVGVNLTNPEGNLSTGWITYNPSQPGTISKISSKNVIINVTVPEGQDPGLYWTNITSNATGCFGVGYNCSPNSNCWDSLLLNVTVPANNSWNLDKDSLIITIPTEITNYNFNITLNNTGNINKTWTIEQNWLSGASPKPTVTPDPSSAYVTKAGSENYSQKITFNVITTSVNGGNYTLNISFRNSSADPDGRNVYVYMNVTDIPPQINNPSVSPSTADMNYEPVTISSSIHDNTNISHVWINITRPDNTIEIINYTVNQPDYTLTHNYIATQAGNYSLRIYANDTAQPTAGLNQSDLLNFTSIGNTNVAINSNTTSITITGITQDSGNSFVLNISVNNTGQSRSYYTNQTFELPNGWTANPNNFSYNNLTSGSYRHNVSTISIPRATSPSLYYSIANITWLNPNNTITSNITTITVNVSSNPVLNIIQSTINISLNHNSSNSTNFTINSTGNTNVTNILINCTSGNCTDLNISFSPSSITTLGPMNTTNITVNVSAYLGFPAGNYLLTINASGTGTSDTVSLNVTVLENKSWNRTPESFSELSVGLNSTGDIGTINLTNYGNVPLTFTVNVVNTTENATNYIFVNTSSITVNKQSSDYLRINYSSPSSIGPSSVTYSVNISISNTTATPSYPLNSTASIKVWQFIVNVSSPNQTNIASLYAGNITTVYVNATIGDSIIGNLGSGENITWNVSIGSTNCPLNGSPTFNTYWIINCTAPSLTDAIYYTLTVIGNYTNTSGGINGALATDSEVNVIYYIDITLPNITPYVDSVPIGDNASLRANVTDNLDVSKAVAEITFPNSTKRNYTMTNILNVSNITTWEYNLTNVAYGDYDVKIYANDTTNNWNSNTTWFEAYDGLAWFNGTTLDKDNSPVIINFSLYRSNTTSRLYNFSSNSSGNYSQQIKKRYYDFNILAFNNTINLTNVSINGDVGNATAAPISLDNIPVSQIGSGIRMSKAMYVQTILNYTNAVLVLNYTGTSYTSENYLGVYRCGNWAFTTRNCSSSWLRISSALDTTSDTLIFSTTDLSGAYVAAEFICGDNICDTTYGESFAWCTNDCHCGNGICDYSETTTTCPSDCISQPPPSGGGGGGGGGGVTVTPPEVEVAVPISLSTSLIEVKLYPGEYQISSIGITNNKKEDIEVSLSVDGDIWPFTLFEKDKITVKSKQTEYAKIKFFTMPTTIPGIYNGNIIVKTGDITQKISVILRVEYEREKLLDIKVESITKEVVPGEKLKYQVTLYNLGLTKRVDVFINYTVRSVETEKVIAVDKETLAIETSLSFMRLMPIPEKAEPGLYTIEAVAWYENKSASSVASFSVIKPPWIYSLLLMIFTNWLTYVILFVAIPCFYLGWKTYEKWKVEKKVRARYIRPINLNKLPTKGIWLGKVAETTANAFFDENKLTTHMIIAGGTGSGKTVAGMIIAEECLKKNIPVIVFDPTAQWTGFIRPSRDKAMQVIYSKFGIKPEESRGFKGTIVQVKDPFLKVEIEKYIKEGEITVFVLNKLTPDQLDYFVRKTVDYMFTIPWPESRPLKTLIVFDEVHRLLPKYAKQIGISIGGGEGYLAIERACREFRKWGLGLVMISQVLLDFRGAIRAVIATESQMRTKYEGDIERIKTKYGWEYSTAIPKLEIGTGMIQNPEYNDGKPWFIRYRPLLHDSFRLTEEELNMYEDYMKEIENLGKEIETLKSRNIDTYDMELELKLASDKVKTAQMRMAETYIESVKSRIKTIEEKS